MTSDRSESSADGQLVLHVQRNDGIFGAPKDAEPQAQLNDTQMTVNWGRNDLPLPPGDTRLRIEIRRGKRRYGAAEAPIRNAAGQQLELFYAPPMWAFLGGRLGNTPQPFRGRLALAGLLGLMLVIVLAAIVVIVVLQVVS